MAHDFSSKLDHILEKLKSSIALLRTGRASPALVEDLEVEYYGAKTPLKVIAAISSPSPRELAIQPWDKNALQPIERAILASPLGLNPVTDRDTIRLAIPALTEERRRELTKFLGRSMEDARIQVRKDREDALREADHRARAKEIGEDEKFRIRNDIQKRVDEANKKIEDIGAAKEKEIMTV